MNKFLNDKPEINDEEYFRNMFMSSEQPKEESLEESLRKLASESSQSQPNELIIEPIEEDPARKLAKAVLAKEEPIQEIDYEKLPKAYEEPITEIDYEKLPKGAQNINNRQVTSNVSKPSTNEIKVDSLKELQAKYPEELKQILEMRSSKPKMEDNSEQSFENKLQEAQNQERNMRLANALIQGSAQIASGAIGSGAQVKPIEIDTTPFTQNVKQLQAAKEKDIESQTIKAFSDPTSAISQAAREQISKSFPQLATKEGFENISAAQLQKLGLKITPEQYEGLTPYQQLSLDLRRKELSSKDEARETSKLLRQQARVDREVDEVAKKVEKNEIFQQASAIKEIEDVLQKEGISLDDPKTYKKGSVPGLGVVGKFTPGFLLSEDGTKVRQNLQSLANRLLKSRSGAAVTDQEYKRFLLELEAGAIPSQENMIQGLQKMKRDVTLTSKNIEKEPEIMEEYEKRTGLKLPHKDLLKTETSKKDPNIEKYAKDYNLSYDQADKILRSRGYGK